MTATTTVTQPILVMTDHVGNDEDGYTLTTPSKELLTLARTLTSGRIDAIALNSAPDLEALSRYGVNRVITPDLTGVSPRVSMIVSDCVEQVARVERDYLAILIVSNYRGREVAATVAMRLHSGAAVDVTECDVADGMLRARKSILAGTWTTAFEVRRGTPVIAVRPSSQVAIEVEAPTTVARVDVAIEFSEAAKRIDVVSSTPQSTSGRVALTEASVVVCGGRGVDGDFTAVEGLADALGGAVGATRVACDEGWIERRAQIGQTGVSVAPRLYVGLGVSGAIHHVCGIQASERIVAVCDDPDAPIFDIADLGIVGRVEDVVPAAIERLSSRA